jgi:hypothetical protein
MVSSESQSGQDLFVLYCTKFKKNGTYLEIGSWKPKFGNNTYLLETQYNWEGFMVEHDKSLLEEYKLVRPNSYYLMNDATQINFLDELQKVSFPKDIDYLQIDLEINNRSTLTTLENLDTQILDIYKFAVVTFEHDVYASNKYYNSDDLYDTRIKSRTIFENRGYFRVFSDVKNDGNPFEDWYVHPSLVDMNYIYNITSTQSLDYKDIIDVLQLNY